MRRAVITSGPAALAGIVSWYCPSRVVVAPTRRDEIDTVAFASAVPSDARTSPDATVGPCADAAAGSNAIAARITKCERPRTLWCILHLLS